MSRIQIADLNSSNYNYILDVNNDEMSFVIGGWVFALRAAGWGISIAIRIASK
jgi:hypothetical protein